MSLAQGELWGLVGAFFMVALLYSSVGFGGGSSYLAILSLVIISFFALRTTALLCNLAVVSGSCFLYYKKGHLQLKKFLPFIVTSIPLAFLGASFRLKESVFFVILGTVLILSSVVLILQTLKLNREYESKKYPNYVSYLLGGGIGLLSGMVGIGGGIFLAPVLNHLKWDKPIVIAALASFFIMVNSISGLIGYVNATTFELFWPEVLFLLGAVLLGGQIGVRLSLGQFSAKAIRLVTAILVFVVGVRVLVINGLQINFFQ